MRKFSFIFFLSLATSLYSRAQVWVPDNGDGTYKNPVLYADYSDPDVIRVGDDYYLVASSFTSQPGIPVLRSKDLVNWTIINHVYTTLPLQRYQKPQHGQGSWAPSIRYHAGKFYVYFCTPQDGLFMALATDPAGRWDLHLVQDVSNWEDPCPFWDSDGKAYLLHGKTGAGPAILHRMSADGLHLLDNGVVIYKDAEKQPTLEGFKFMEKREGYYYFAAPAGGVGKGWQSVFRSKNIYGPYEDHIVLRQGKTTINGPHQGGFVETQTGEWWFMHFQDKGAYGRIVHLQPVHWKDGWPETGVDGEPVMTYHKPNVGKTCPVQVPQTSDEFNGKVLGQQWQWQAAPDPRWYQLTGQAIRLPAISVPTDNGNLLYAGNLLLQKFAAPEFQAITKMDCDQLHLNERAGIAVMGNYYTCLCVESRAAGKQLVLYEGKKQGAVSVMNELAGAPLHTGAVWLKAVIDSNALCRYSYSLDGQQYQMIGSPCRAEKGEWIGAKTGIFCISPDLVNAQPGYAGFDYFRVEKLKP